MNAAEMYCIRCSYPLDDSRPIGACPECGTPYDAARALTWAASPRIAFIRRLLAPSTSTVELALIIAACLLLLYSYAAPSVLVTPRNLAVIMILIIIAAWLARLFDKLFYCPRKVVCAIVGMSLSPILLVCSLVLIKNDLPLKTVFSVFQSKFDQLGRKSEQGSVMSGSHECVGCYSLEVQGVYGNGIVAFGVSGEYNDRCFVYVPERERRSVDERAASGQEWVRLSRNWFLWDR